MQRPTFFVVIIFVIGLLTTFGTPLVVAAQALIGPQLQELTMLVVGWLALLALTAGLFEEIGRYVGCRWLMKRTTKT